MCDSGGGRQRARQDSIPLSCAPSPRRRRHDAASPRTRPCGFDLRPRVQPGSARASFRAAPGESAKRRRSCLRWRRDSRKLRVGLVVGVARAVNVREVLSPGRERSAAYAARHFAERRPVGCHEVIGIEVAGGYDASRAMHIAVATTIPRDGLTALSAGEWSLRICVHVLVSFDLRRPRQSLTRRPVGRRAKRSPLDGALPNARCRTRTCSLRFGHLISPSPSFGQEPLFNEGSCTTSAPSGARRACRILTNPTAHVVAGRRTIGRGAQQ